MDENEKCVLRGWMADWLATCNVLDDIRIMRVGERNMVFRYKKNCVLIDQSI
jgi:hypothetical protein